MNEGRQLLLVLNDIPFDRSSGSPGLDFSLSEIGGVVAAMHMRGVIHGELYPSFVSRYGVRLSPQTRFLLPSLAKGEEEMRVVYYSHLAERNEDFDIFCLGILALLQCYGLKYRRYESTGFPSHFYDTEGEFIHQDTEGKELPPHWRRCLHRDPEKRALYSGVEHLLLYPLPTLPLNCLFSNDFLLSFKSYPIFDLARKYPREIVARVSEEEFRRRITEVTENLSRPLSTQGANEITLPILHHDTLPLYHMLRDDDLFHEGLRLLSTKVSLASVSDSYLLEFFINYTRHLHRDEEMRTS